MDKPIGGIVLGKDRDDEALIGEKGGDQQADGFGKDCAWADRQRINKSKRKIWNLPRRKVRFGENQNINSPHFTIH